MSKTTTSFKAHLNELAHTFVQLIQQLVHNHPNNPAQGFISVVKFINTYQPIIWQSMRALIKQAHWPSMFMQAHNTLVRNIFQQLLGNTSTLANTTASMSTSSTSGKFDRFKHELWRKNPFFNYLHQAYLLIADHTSQKIQALPLDAATKRQALFLWQLMMDALAPSNFILTNPEILQQTYRTRGVNLVQGVTRWLNDIIEYRGYMNITRAPKQAFHYGKTIAATAGEVIFQNELMQLIQYRPSTEQVYQQPILLVSSWINKFYVFDLKPNNSIVAWLVAQGFTVFAISWVNPDKTLNDRDFADYVLQGPVTAIEHIYQRTQAPIHTVGYCLGGTLLATALAYLNPSHWIASTSFFATLLDFHDAGGFANLTQEPQLQFFEQKTQDDVWPADHMATAFNLIAMNEAYWSYWIRYYWLGKNPIPYEGLFWACDMTHTTGALYRFYTRALYNQNLLANRDKVIVAEKGIDLTQIGYDSFFVGFSDDYISPWKAVYRSCALLENSARTFVLSSGGHFNSVTQSPTSKHGQYWRMSNNERLLADEAETWQQHCEHYLTTWQSYWLQWLQERSSGKLAARVPEHSLESAPGSYIFRA